MMAELVILATDEAFERLHEARPGASVTVVNGVGRQNEHFVALRPAKRLIDDRGFTVQLTALRIFVLGGSVHHVFIGLRNDCDQEVQENHEDQKLVEPPNEPHQIDGGV